jgi:uncharacterized membrane protein YccF (DUF307 family)
VFDRMQVGYSAALGWVYFALCMVVLIVITVPVSRKIFYADEN